MSASRIVVIATGDELVQGSIADANSGWIARRLSDLGFETTRFVVLGDDEERLRATLADLVRDHVAILITGGLGPTLDDVTRHACAAAARQRPGRARARGRALSLLPR